MTGKIYQKHLKVQVFDQYDPGAPTGESTYGDDFVTEMQKDGKWEAAWIVLEGD